MRSRVGNANSSCSFPWVTGDVGTCQVGASNTPEWAKPWCSRDWLHISACIYLLCPGLCQQHQAIFTQKYHILEGLWEHPASCPDCVSRGVIPASVRWGADTRKSTGSCLPAFVPNSRTWPKANPGTFSHWNFHCFINQLVVIAYCAFIGCLHFSLSLLFTLHLKISHAA